MDKYRTARSLAGRRKGLLATAGLAIGMSLLSILASSSYVFVRSLLIERGASSATVVIQPTVNPARQLLGTPTISEESIAAIGALADTRSVAPVSTNAFTMTGELGVAGVRFRTEMFIEAVPTSFLHDELRLAGPHAIAEWEEAQYGETIPILISNDFLSLFNFAYAVPRGFPPIRASNLRALSVEISFYPPDGGPPDVMPAKVVGTTTLIRSILMPLPYLVEAHKAAGGPVPPQYRIILRTADPTTDELAEILDAHNLEIVEAPGSDVSIAGIARTSLIVIGVFVLALLVSTAANSVLRLDALLLRKRPLIDHLRLLGYHRDEIARIFLRPSRNESLLSAAVGATFAFLPVAVVPAIVSLLGLPTPPGAALGAFAGVAAVALPLVVILQRLRRTFDRVVAGTPVTND